MQVTGQHLHLRAERSIEFISEVAVHQESKNSSD
jgi:hypothetical protein